MGCDLQGDSYGRFRNICHFPPFCLEMEWYNVLECGLDPCSDVIEHIESEVLWKRRRKSNAGMG